MNIKEFLTQLDYTEKLRFTLPNGKKVPAHFHVTEIGIVNKHMIDCGGVERKESVVSMQLWTSIDLHHRLKPQKLKKIVEMAQEKMGITDEEIEIEYQGNTIEKYGLACKNGELVLTNKQTDCLAKDACGIPGIKKKVSLDALKADDCCSPSSGCC